MKAKMFVVAVGAFALGMVAQWVNERTPEAAAAPISAGPVFYQVAQWGNVRVNWFESGDTECYVMTAAGYRETGGGISCMRKAQP